MKLKYIVKENKTIKQVLREDLSISERLYKKIKKDKIFVNGKHAKSYQDIQENDIVEVDLDFNETCENIIPNPNIKIDILYEDEWLLIVNKQPFVPVHPCMECFENSLSNGVKYYFDTHNIHKKIRIVNRLDKNTTGIVIFAKTEYIQENLGFYEKEYITIVEGTITGKGTINEPIARKDKSIIERCVSKDGQTAITEYEAIKNFTINNTKLSLAKCILKTGRTHQIRVHMSYINHPLLGDSLYGKSSNLINRQALHAYHIQFIHPVTRKLIDVTAPIPEDMENLIK